jgi:hypothetical protein
MRSGIICYVGEAAEVLDCLNIRFALSNPGREIDIQ